MLGHRNFIKSGMHCSGLASFQRSVVFITTMSGCDRELKVHSLLCCFTLVSHALLYTNPVTLYYSENMCTNQGATSTSDTQAVNACTCASISEPTTVL